MIAALRQRLLTWTEAPTLALALRYIGEYAALRLWVLVVGCFPIDMNLRTARLLGRIWWQLMPRHRERALDNLRPALGADSNARGLAAPGLDARALRRIARRSFEHFAQLYLVETPLMPRAVSEWSWARHVELDSLGEALRTILGGRGGLTGGGEPIGRDEFTDLGGTSGRGVILITGHFGSYELLGYTICRLGIPLTAVMRPLDNPLINAWLMRSRRAGGLTLLYKKGVTAVAGQVLDRGEPLCFIADQDAGRRGLFVNFFGRPASTYKSIGLLAMQKRVPIVVGYAVRVRRGFHYRLAVERIIRPEEWEQPADPAATADPLRWITQTFTSALESAIRRWPEQYLWVHRRWKHQPQPRDASRSKSSHELGACKVCLRVLRGASGSLAEWPCLILKDWICETHCTETKEPAFADTHRSVAQLAGLPSPPPGPDLFGQLNTICRRCPYFLR